MDPALYSHLIDLALAEDIGPGDATSEAVLPPDLCLRAHIIAKQAGVVAGLPVAEAVFRRVDPSVRFTARFRTARVEAGTVLAEVEGPARKPAGGGADGAQLPPASLRHRHPHPPLRGRRRRDPRGHPGYP